MMISIIAKTALLSFFLFLVLVIIGYGYTRSAILLQKYLAVFKKRKISSLFMSFLTNHRFCLISGKLRYIYIFHGMKEAIINYKLIESWILIAWNDYEVHIF